MPDPISINDEEVFLGEQQELHLNIARLPTYSPIELSVHVLRGEKDGPVLLLTGGLHGDEINGVEIIRRLITSGQATPQRGTVIAVPLVNIYGFIQKQRDLPDGKDINRSFPGSKNGSLARLVAHRLIHDILPYADCGIDYHTGGAARANYPQIRCLLKNERDKELAEAFAAPITLHSSLINKSFRKEAQKRDTSILVYETGEAHRFDEFGIQEGINGTVRLMKKLNMCDEAPPANNMDIYQKSTWVRSGFGGLFHAEIALGDGITQKQILGHISDPFGNEWFDVRSRQTGRVIGLTNSPVVHKGDALVHIAYKKK